MIRRRSILSAILATLTMVAAFASMPAPAQAMTMRDTGEIVHYESHTYEENIASGLIDPNFQSIYSPATTNDLKSNTHDTIVCHCYQKINEAELRHACADTGLDFDFLVQHELPQVKTIGWHQNAYGEWFYMPYINWATGWQNLGGKWYYFGEDEFDSYARRGWNQIEGKWYYFNPSTCDMVSNTTVDGYYINTDGVATFKKKLIVSIFIDTLDFR